MEYEDAEYGVKVTVSVPSFGDSFFIIMKISSIIGKLIAGFRPLIRGFFFYEDGFITDPMVYKEVSVPSFGDSFFIGKLIFCAVRDAMEFPSPHSGILFLFEKGGEEE